MKFLHVQQDEKMIFFSYTSMIIPTKTWQSSGDTI